MIQKKKLKGVVRMKNKEIVLFYIIKLLCTANNKKHLLKILKDAECFVSVNLANDKND